MTCRRGMLGRYSGVSSSSGLRGRGAREGAFGRAAGGWGRSPGGAERGGGIGRGTGAVLRAQRRFDAEAFVVCAGAARGVFVVGRGVWCGPGGRAHRRATSTEPGEPLWGEQKRWSSGCWPTSIGPMGFARCRCAASTPLAPIPRGVSASATSPRHTSSHAPSRPRSQARR